jgi:membrane dipeptidase
MRVLRAAAFLLPCVLVAAQVAAQDAALKHARERLAKVPLVDGHNDLVWEIRDDGKGDPIGYDLRKRREKGDTDIPRLREGLVSGQLWSVWIPSGAPGGAARTQLEQIDIARRMIADYSDVFMLATKADDVEAAHRAGKIASFLGMENGQALENSLGALRAYYDLGVRYMTLTHGRNTDWADSATDTPAHGGLTPFGSEVVREMNRLGMLVDISHVSPEVMRRVLDVTEAPVMFSHSSARALVDHPRDVPDDVLARMPKNGGIVMVTFIPAFVSSETAAWGKSVELLVQGAKTSAEIGKIQDEYAKTHGPAPRATLKQVADHVEHVAKVAGIDHVGIGSDFYGGGPMPLGLEDVSHFPELFAELIRRGWSDADLTKLAGGNIVRTLRDAEGVAARLQKERRPSVATYEELDHPKP